MSQEKSIDDVKIWIKAMGTKGIYGGAAARLRTTALEQVVSVMGDDESREVNDVLGKVDSLANRWATKNQAKPETAATYLSKAKTTLQDFIRYHEDPMKFARTAPAPKGNGQSKGTAPRTSKAPIAPEPPPVRTGSSNMRSYPVSKGDIEFTVPAELTTMDVLKFSLHLLTFAADFDPKLQSQMFALQRQS